LAERKERELVTDDARRLNSIQPIYPFITLSELVAHSKQSSDPSFTLFGLLTAEP